MQAWKANYEDLELTNIKLAEKEKEIDTLKEQLTQQKDLIEDLQN